MFPPIKVIDASTIGHEAKLTNRIQQVLHHAWGRGRLSDHRNRRFFEACQTVATFFWSGRSWENDDWAQYLGQNDNSLNLRVNCMMAALWGDFLTYMLLLPNLATSDFCCSENQKKKYIIENTGRFLARIFSVLHGTSHTSCSSMSRVICSQQTHLPNIHHTVIPSKERIYTYPTYMEVENHRLKSAKQ